MVPVLSVEDGRWLLSEQLEVMMKPGGHGAIWKLMLDEGVFDWLQQRGCQVGAGAVCCFWCSWWYWWWCLAVWLWVPLFQSTM